MLQTITPQRGGGDTATSSREEIYFTPVMELRVGDASLVGVGKRAPHGFRCLWLVSPHGSLDRLKTFRHYFPT